MPVGRSQIARDAVGPELLPYFLSTEQTGTGAEQSIPHGLGVTPSLVFFFITGDARAAWAVFSITEGAHDDTNLKVTVTTDMKFRAFAMA